MTATAVASVILAAGQGTRMKSDLPKVLHAVADVPMALYPVRLVRALGCQRQVMVVGHGAEAVQVRPGQ